MTYSIVSFKRSHKAWKSLVAYDLLGGLEDFMSNRLKDKFDWVTSLPMYQHIDNTTVHSALGMGYYNTMSCMNI